MHTFRVLLLNRTAKPLAFCLGLLSCLFSVPAAAQTQDTQRFDSDGVQIRYLDRGSGDPVVLLHGFTSRLDSWQGTGIIAGLVDNGFRAVAYDSRGHGGSAKPHHAAQYGGEEIRDLIRLLDHLSIERAHLVGYSRGAGKASQIVTRHPDRVRSVVFGGWAPGGPVEALSPADCQAVADSLARGEYPLPLLRALEPDDVPLPSPEERAQQMKRLAAGNDVKALAAAFRSDCDNRLATASDLRATGLPILVIAGDRDGFAPSVRDMRREIDDSLETLLIPGADHFTTLGHPQFLDRLVAFLGKQLAGSEGESR
jgi:pimeloyl-ACP methyl ester carboxylesterase